MVWFLQRQRGRVLLALATALAAMPAAAQETDDEGRVPDTPQPSIATSLPRAWADPGGVRSALAGRGITFAIDYIGEVLDNPTGGFKQGPNYDGRIDVELRADLSKLLGLKGLSFFANVYQINGTSISADNLGVLMPVSFIEALPTTRLFELWLDQKLLDNKVSIRFGQLAADSEFLLTDGAAAFLNGTWGWPSITATDQPIGGPSYPFATPGVRVSYSPNDQLKLMVGLYNGDPVGPCNVDPQKCDPYGLEFRISEPALVMAEGDYKYNQDEGKLAGTVRLGSWVNLGDFDHPSFNSAGGFIAIADNDIDGGNNDWGFYGIIDQMIYRLPGKGPPKGVSVFGRLIGAPSDRNIVDLYADGGIVLSGLMDNRPDDMFGIGVAYTGISDHSIAAAKEAGQTVLPNFEAVLEASYTAQIIPGFTIQPDFQYFWNPGGHAPDPDDPAKAVPDAAVFGLRTTINY